MISVILVSQLIFVSVLVSGLFFVHDIKFLPQCQLLRNHCTIQKIAHAQYGVNYKDSISCNVSSVLQTVRHHHGNKSRTAWFIFRNTRSSSVPSIHFRSWALNRARSLGSAVRSPSGVWAEPWLPTHFYAISAQKMASCSAERRRLQTRPATENIRSDGADVAAHNDVKPSQQEVMMR